MKFSQILNENANVQHGLEVLATLILDALAQRTSSNISGYNQYYGNLENFNYSSLDGVDTSLLEIMPVPMPVRRLARRGVEVCLRPGTSYCEITKHRRKISLEAPRGFLRSAIEFKDDPAAIRQILQASLPGLVHELTHLFDDQRSKGKYVKNTKSMNTIARSKAMEADPSEENQTAWSSAYAEDPAEINAWFQAAVTAIKYARTDDFESYCHAFIENFPHFTTLEKPIQRRLLKRLAVQWQTPDPVVKTKRRNPK